MAQHFQKAWPNVQRPNVGAYTVDFGNKIYIPSDLCEILPGNAYRSLLSGNHNTNMINFACRKPKQNQDLILREDVPFLRLGVAGGPSERFGITLTDAQPQMMQINARLLPAPNITFADFIHARELPGAISPNDLAKAFRITASEWLQQPDRREGLEYHDCWCRRGRSGSTVV